MIEEDKVTLMRTRAELVEQLAAQLAPHDRIRIQGELSIVNAKIKAINTTEAAQLKAAADRRKVAGLAEAQANAGRAIARVQAKHGGSWPSSPPGTPGHGDPINKQSVRDRQATPGDDGPDDDDDDPGQTRAIDGWIDAVLLRHDVDFTRDARGGLMLTSDPSRPHVPQNLAAVIEVLVTGIYAAARGQELPDLPIAPAQKNPKAAKPPKAAKLKKR